MTIRAEGVSAVTVDELLRDDLRIPHYQRPYSWEPATALQLIDDVRDAEADRREAGGSYVLGSVILHQQEDGSLDVVDGQQRLLTLRMIVALLDPDDTYTVRSDRDSPVSRVWAALQRDLRTLDAARRSRLLAFMRTRCELVRVVTDVLDEAFRVFDSQNYRGKPLAPHDLLKAHHLREMSGETEAMRAAVVETWESVTDEDLDRLFSVYLYRIARWSRSESAPQFTVHDIDMFKGISAKRMRSPSARYHLAAQAALPMLTSWTGTPSAGDVDGREARRARFQLDAPMPAGRAFFEMVDFMLAELKSLIAVAFDDQTERFSIYACQDLHGSEGKGALRERPSHSRYRYVSELYVAALLYCTNKFGDEGLDAARAQLFAWAYAPRIQLLRVQFRSIDNRAKGDESVESAFGLLRNAMSGRVLNRLPTTAERYPKEGHEEALVAYLKRSEAL